MRPEDNESNSSSCLCPGCPTFNDCMEQAGQRLFCSKGETACDPSSSGCICPECPVWASNQLDGTYYCMQGAAT